MGHKHKFTLFIATFFGLVTMFQLAIPMTTFAQADDSGINLQITPSPIIDTIKPGVEQTIEFQIRNSGTKTEELDVYLRKFSISNETGEVQLSNDEPTDVSDWAKLSNPKLKIEPGATFTEKLVVNPPKDIGFSYSFAIMISRSNEGDSQEAGETTIKGAIAVFTLLTVDRPGAIRKFDIVEFSSKKRVYEYLPAELTVKLKNVGNTIVQPYGNIFIQKSATSNEPISVLKLNDTAAYVLPDVTRSFTSTWDDGFPVYVQKTTAADGQPKMQLEWDWGNGKTFRIGRYYAKVVAVYNDGQRDVPVESTISFWVIPWKMIIAALFIVGILLVGIITIIKKPIKSIKNKKASKKPATDETNNSASDEN
jgi:hypothetical protein